MAEAEETVIEIFRANEFNRLGRPRGTIPRNTEVEVNRVLGTDGKEYVQISSLC